MPSSQVMALGIVPMCSYQMERMFNTTRIPGKESGTGPQPGARAGAVRTEAPPSQLWACHGQAPSYLLARHQASWASQGHVMGKSIWFVTNTRHLLFTGTMLVLGLCGARNGAPALRAFQGRGS